MTSKAAETRLRPEQAGDDLIRIVAKLTRDVERFDTAVSHHRRLLEHLAGHLDDLDSSQLNLQSERITLEAAEMVASARQALERLSRLAEPPGSVHLTEAARHRPTRSPEDGQLN